MMGPLRVEAIAISKYLIGISPSDDEISAYMRAHGCTNMELESQNHKAIWTSMVRSSMLMGIFDAGLRINAPHCQIRKKITLMLAILETSTRHTDKFLPQKFRPIDWLKFAAAMASASLRSILGYIIVKVVIK